MNWSDNTASSLALKKQFPNGIPALDCLEFVQLSYSFSCVLGQLLKLVVLAQEGFDFLPARWIEQGAKRVKFSFSLQILKASINIFPSSNKNPVFLNIEIKDNSFKVVDFETKDVLLEAVVCMVDVDARGFV